MATIRNDASEDECSVDDKDDDIFLSEDEVETALISDAVAEEHAVTVPDPASSKTEDVLCTVVGDSTDLQNIAVSLKVTSEAVPSVFATLEVGGALGVVPDEDVTSTKDMALVPPSPEASVCSKEAEDSTCADAEHTAEASVLSDEGPVLNLEQVSSASAQEKASAESETKEKKQPRQRGKKKAVSEKLIDSTASDPSEQHSKEKASSQAQKTEAAASEEGNEYLGDGVGQEEGDEELEEEVEEPKKKVYEPYDVPGAGFAFFLHDDRYSGSGRGAGRGRGRRQDDRRSGRLWEEDGGAWGHDKFHEMEIDDAPPRMMTDAPIHRGTRWSGSSERRTGRGSQGNIHSRPNRGSALHSEANAHAAATMSAASRGPRHQPANLDSPSVHLPRHGSGRGRGRGAFGPEASSHGSTDHSRGSTGAGRRSGPNRDRHGQQPLDAAMTNAGTQGVAKVEAFPVLEGPRGSRRYLQARDLSTSDPVSMTAQPPTMVSTTTSDQQAVGQQSNDAAPDQAQYTAQGGYATMQHTAGRAQPFNPNAAQFQPTSNPGSVQGAYNVGTHAGLHGGVAAGTSQVMFQPMHINAAGVSNGQVVQGSVQTGTQLPGMVMVPQLQQQVPMSNGMGTYALGTPQIQGASQQMVYQQQAVLNQMGALQLGQADMYPAVHEVASSYPVNNHGIWMPNMGLQGGGVASEGMGFTATGYTVPGQMYMPQYTGLNPEAQYMVQPPVAAAQDGGAVTSQAPAAAAF